MLSAETTRIERRIRSRGTILTQMRNSLSRHTINNRDKGFMVARETAAIKVSGCFQSVNSRCHKVGARPGVASRHSLPTTAGARRFRLSQISTTAMDCICIHVCYIYTLFASNHGIGCFPRRDPLLLRPQKMLRQSYTVIFIIFKIVKPVRFLQLYICIGNKYYFIK